MSIEQANTVSWSKLHYRSLRYGLSHLPMRQCVKQPYSAPRVTRWSQIKIYARRHSICGPQTKWRYLDICLPPSLLRSKTYIIRVQKQVIQPRPCLSLSFIRLVIYEILTFSLREGPERTYLQRYVFTSLNHVPIIQGPRFILRSFKQQSAITYKIDWRNS